MNGLVFDTVKGWMGVVTSQSGIALVTRPWHIMDQAKGELIESFQGSLWFNEQPKDHLSERFAAKVSAYFAGERVIFDEPVDLSRVSSFDRAVLEVVQGIPFGEVKTYAWVANQIGRPKAARPVGQAVGRNPVPIIVPCHRVIGSDGGLRGFGWGLELKEWLLGLEGTI